MGYTVKVDRDLCIGSGACVADAPNAFQLDKENIAVVQPGAADLSDERLVEIARACPPTAIFVYDEDGEEVDIFA